MDDYINTHKIFRESFQWIGYNMNNEHNRYGILIQDLCAYNTLNWS